MRSTGIRILIRRRASFLNSPISRENAECCRSASWTCSRRHHMVLIGTFAMIAVVLAAVGLYARIAYAVVERYREIAIGLRWVRVRKAFSLSSAEGPYNCLL